MSPHWKWQVLPEGEQKLRGRVFSGEQFHHFPGAFSDEVKYFTMIVPQESGQLPLSRLGDAMCEVGNSVQLSFHLLRMEKEPIFWYLLGRKIEKILMFQSVTSPGCGIFLVSPASVHWRGFSSWCRFGLKGKMLGMVGLTGRFRANLVFFLETLRYPKNAGWDILLIP